jgi:hypothetical protein
VAQELLGDAGVGVGVLAQRVQLVAAGVAGPTGDGERDHHPLADLEVGHRRADLDHLAQPTGWAGRCLR